MRKIILTLVIGIVTLFTLSSCVTGAYAQEIEIGNNDAKLIITYGTPYFYDGVLVYYNYNNFYYYPYVLNGRTYYHRYHRPLPSPRHRFQPSHHRPRTAIHRPPSARPHNFGNRPQTQRPNIGGGQRPSGGHRFGRR